jgi:hypothetical protein
MSSVQQNNQFFRPIGIGRSARSRWFVADRKKKLRFPRRR